MMDGMVVIMDGAMAADGAMDGMMAVIIDIVATDMAIRLGVEAHIEVENAGGKLINIRPSISIAYAICIEDMNYDDWKAQEPEDYGSVCEVCGGRLKKLEGRWQCDRCEQEKEIKYYSDWVENVCRLEILRILYGKEK